MSPENPFCPDCWTPIAGDACGRCARRFLVRDGVLDRIGPDAREERAADVEAFYSVSPFPGYAPGDDAATLIDRSRRSPFLRALDDSIPPDARVLDAGCGTAQTAAFLALSASGRTVVGIDGCRVSLAHADEFRRRSGARNLQLCRADLFDLPVSPGRYEVVVSRGVVHHTPDPARAIECVASCVAPDGYLLLGFYETRGRAFHCARRALGRIVGRPIALLDPILRRRDLDDEKKRIWIDDQYRHPLEHILPLPWVQRTLKRLGFRWVRPVPPLSARTHLFDPTPEPGPFGRGLLRAGWLARGCVDPDAGLVLVVARRHS